MHPLHEAAHLLTRRQVLGRGATGLGTIALASLLNPRLFASDERKPGTDGLVDFPNFTPRAKRVIYLFQSGAPSQMDLFDYKPKLAELRGQNLPDSIRNGQRLTGMTSGQKSFPVAPSIFKFDRYGRGGIWLSELMPHTATI